MLIHLVANLVSALANLDIYDFPHYTGKLVEWFACLNPQPGLISFVVNGLLSIPFDRGFDRSASSYETSIIHGFTVNPFKNQNRNQADRYICWTSKTSLSRQTRFRQVVYTLFWSIWLSKNTRIVYKSLATVYFLKAFQASESSYCSKRMVEYQEKNDR